MAYEGDRRWSVTDHDHWLWKWHLQSTGGPAAVEQAVRALFDEIAAFDNDGFRAAVTPDLELIEDTLRLDREGFVALMQRLEGQLTVAFDLVEFNTEFAGPIAYTSYRNRAVFSAGGQVQNGEFLESIVLRWLDGEWKIDRLHSTPVEREEG